MNYQLYLRSRGYVVQKQNFDADGDAAAQEVAGAVFFSTDGYWDTYDLWGGGRLIRSTIAENLGRLARNIEEIAVAIEEAIQIYPPFANDEKLGARIREIRQRRGTGAL